MSSLEQDKAHQNEFVRWFRKRVIDENASDDEDIRNLARGPASGQVVVYQQYICNGYCFQTRNIERTTQTSGIMVMGSHYGALGDDYYGIILEEVIGIDYKGANKVVLFHCTWANLGKGGVRKDKVFGLVEVNWGPKYPAFDPFILAFQATQVFYTPEMKTKNRKGWLAVIEGKSRKFNDSNEVEDEGNDTLQDENPRSVVPFEEITFEPGEWSSNVVESSRKRAYDDDVGDQFDCEPTFGSEDDEVEDEEDELSEDDV